MREVGIGRVLVASLHEAISEVLPTRLGFYESWLHAEGLREGTIGVAPLSAVLSFLRQEGAAYDRVMRRAGEHAAEWTVASMAPFERNALGAAPMWLRVRLLLRTARQLVRSSCVTSRATATVRRGTARIQLRDSIFCGVREPVPHPLCGFYAAAFERLLLIFDVETTAEVESCRGTGSPSGCVLTLAIARRAVAPQVKESAA